MIAWDVLVFKCLRMMRVQQSVELYSRHKKGTYAYGVFWLIRKCRLKIDSKDSIFFLHFFSISDRSFSFRVSGSVMPLKLHARETV